MFEFDLTIESWHVPAIIAIMAFFCGLLCLSDRALRRSIERYQASADQNQILAEGYQASADQNQILAGQNQTLMRNNRTVIVHNLFLMVQNVILGGQIQFLGDRFQETVQENQILVEENQFLVHRNNRMGMRALFARDPDMMQITIRHIVRLEEVLQRENGVDASLHREREAFYRFLAALLLYRALESTNNQGRN